MDTNKDTHNKKSKIKEKMGDAFFSQMECIMGGKPIPKKQETKKTTISKVFSTPVSSSEKFKEKNPQQSTQVNVSNDTKQRHNVVTDSFVPASSRGCSEFNDLFMNNLIMQQNILLQQQQMMQQQQQFFQQQMMQQQQFFQQQFLLNNQQNFVNKTNRNIFIENKKIDNEPPKTIFIKKQKK